MYSKIISILLILHFPLYINAQSGNFYNQLSEAAIGLTKSTVIYDPSYVKLKYPNGDVPANRGVCTDVVIRAYRKLGIDLQKEVHLDMKANFNLYPSKKRWGMKSTDTNIDHRRVPNLQTFFGRNGKSLSISKNAEDYQSGELITWNLDNGLPHIGIVVDLKTKDGKRPLVVHNVGWGQVTEDVLFKWKITGRYKYQK